MKTSTTLLLLVLILAASSCFERAMSAPLLCGDVCKQRCARAGVLDRCLKYCGICCEECKCVPSGTYGNKHECPCYRDKVSSKGKPKCP